MNLAILKRYPCVCSAIQYIHVSTFIQYALGWGEGVRKKSTLCTLAKKQKIVDHFLLNPLNYFCSPHYQKQNSANNCVFTQQVKIVYTVATLVSFMYFMRCSSLRCNFFECCDVSVSASLYPLAVHTSTVTSHDQDQNQCLN